MSAGLQGLRGQGRISAMNRLTLTVLLLLLAFFGIADAWYLTQSALTDTALSCNFGSALDGCNIVAQSAYSHLFGLPLALYGVAFYAGTFVLAAALLILPLRLLYRLNYLFGMVGILASIVFLAIQFFLIKALCVYCLASAVIALLIYVISRELWRRFAPPHLVVVKNP